MVQFRNCWAARLAASRGSRLLLFQFLTSWVVHLPLCDVLGGCSGPVFCPQCNLLGNVSFSLRLPGRQPVDFVSFQAASLPVCDFLGGLPCTVQFAGDSIAVLRSRAACQLLFQFLTCRAVYSPILGLLGQVVVHSACNLLGSHYPPAADLLGS